MILSVVVIGCLLGLREEENQKEVDLTLSLSWASLLPSRNLTLHIIAAAVVVCPAIIKVSRLSMISASSSFSSGGNKSRSSMDCRKSLRLLRFPLLRPAINFLNLSMSL
ncbi:hypothetical protein MLD38_030862 [Melastoma candidum]|uniref:Uncharacterized protein n=1 Tax=Melastoma candidum TaxID=119954 RepID=A0ACB9MQ19_9MYRT|nr:hypothetical protein MLD38_030862 [Melastoma candidum]